MRAASLAFLIVAGFVIAAWPAFAVDVPRTPTGYKVAGGKVFTWSGLDGDDTGVPVDVSNCDKLTAHIYSGTYGGSTITLEGSNDSVAGTSSYASAEWAGLADNSGTAISKTADAIEAIQESPVYFRPKTASGTGANIMVGLTCLYQ